MMPRERILRQIRPFLDQLPIKVLLGPRRCGKTTLLGQLQEELKHRGVPDERLISVHFDDPASAPLCRPGALYHHLAERIVQNEGKSYIFLDEVGRASGWERCIDSLNIRYNCDLYLASSSANLLDSDPSIRLGERCVVFRVGPLSLSEFGQRYTAHFPETDERAVFEAYMKLGGLPYLERLGYDEELCAQYLRDAFSAIELADIVRPYQVRDVALLERLLAHVNLSEKNGFSATALSRTLKSETAAASTETMLNYLDACVNAHLLCRVPREDVPTHKLLTVREKYYLMDHGLRDAVYGAQLRATERLLEHAVLAEMLQRGYEVRTGRVGTQEIDFIGDRGDERVYVQVADTMPSRKATRQKFEVFDDVRDNYPKYVVSLDRVDMSRNGIKHRHVRAFLTQEAWN